MDKAWHAAAALGRARRLRRRCCIARLLCAHASAAGAPLAAAVACLRHRRQWPSSKAHIGAHSGSLSLPSVPLPPPSLQLGAAGVISSPSSVVPAAAAAAESLLLGAGVAGAMALLLLMALLPLLVDACASASALSMLSLLLSWSLSARSGERGMLSSSDMAGDGQVGDRFLGARAHALMHHQHQAA